jgi:hypothetical protein
MKAGDKVLVPAKVNMVCTNGRLVVTLLHDVGRDSFDRMIESKEVQAAPQAAAPPYKELLPVPIENADLLAVFQKYLPQLTGRVGLQTISQLVGGLNDLIRAKSAGTALPPDGGGAGLTVEQVERIVKLHHYQGEIDGLKEGQAIFLWPAMTADLNAAISARHALSLEREKRVLLSKMKGSERDETMNSNEYNESLKQHTLEVISAKVHEQWMENKHKAGVTSRKLESGEELMVPYEQLSEQAKELDRGSVRAVLNAQAALASTPSSEPAGKETK